LSQIPSQNPYRLATAGNSAGTLILEFFRNRDRWQHRWLLEHKGQAIIWLTSVEGNEGNEGNQGDGGNQGGEGCEGNQAGAWPPSPPLQELDSLSLSAGPAIFGVGRGGTAHWSVSFLQDRQSATADSILTEWACCWKSNPAHQKTAQPVFQSTYRLAEGVQARLSSANRIELNREDKRLIIEILDAPPHRSQVLLEAAHNQAVHNQAAHNQADHCRADHYQADRLVIAAILSAEPAPNVRWNYRICLQA
jgi:uncharacterized protein (DUF1778 family)